MATLGSSLPSRLRQLLSGDAALGPSIRLDPEPLPEIKSFIDRVISSPLQDIAIPLSGFHWEYNKGNFHHWRPLFLHFDKYFKTYIASRNDLLLSDTILEDERLFPTYEVLQILRVMQIILENCHNKSTFDGLEHFKLLLASTDPEILIAALETLSALVKINPSKLESSGKLIGCGTINSCLLSLAQGWGSKEEGLGLYSCVTINEKKQDVLSLFSSDIQNDCDMSQTRLGSTLYFELHGINFQLTGENSCDAGSSSSKVIHIPDMHLTTDDDLLIMKQCIKKYNVPQEQRFALLSRIRYAHAFRSSRICRLYHRICLLAFIVLVQSNDAHDELVSFFANEPEYTNELIRIVRSEETVPLTIRTLTMYALGAQLAAYASSHEWARTLSGPNISFTGGNRTILFNVLQRAIMSLNSLNDPSSVAFVEALLQFYLFHVISSSNSVSVIRGSGMVSTFMPLLEDSDPTHMHLVCFAVKILQKLMDYSNTAVTMFKDLGGVDLLAHRLQIEVHRVIGLSGTDDNSMVFGKCSKYNYGQLHSQKRLIKVLLKALGSATYAPMNSTRSPNTHESCLPTTLSLIFNNVGKFGGDIYFSTVTVFSEIIHKDPTCFPILDELGLPMAFLSSIVSGLLPSLKALTCVPSGLGAICLSNKGIQEVRDTSALRFLVDIFTTKKYVVAMNGGIVPLANGVEEFLRHVSSLRSSGVDLIIEIINKVASMRDNNIIGAPDKTNGSTVMELDSSDVPNENSNMVNSVHAEAEDISDEQFIQLCVFHLMVLIHRTMENSETCKLFVDKSGIDALLKLLLRSNIAQSSEGVSIALHSTMVFKGFTQHHSVPLARAFCSSLGYQLKKVLSEFSVISGSFLLHPKETPDSCIFSSLFLIEFLLFLAGSKDNRWLTSLLAEFGNGGKGVLEDIGSVHRDVLWQIALLDDAKLELEDDVAGSGDLNTNETEEPRLNSFRQILDPLLRRRTVGWSVETQFVDLINLYRDLGRVTNNQQRLGNDGRSNLQSGQLHQIGSNVSAKGDVKQKSYYSSCCDMMRSLSFHITHLFHELGKVMLAPSRRREDTLNISLSSKSVARVFASIALTHMNSGVHENPTGSETSISVKGRYFGNVIEFIDGILLDKSDSCNPVLLNCFYGHGVIQSVLTTFEATSQLLFTINRAPPSPMETDDVSRKRDEIEDSWIYSSLASYGKFMDHLATSSLILSPFTKHLLAQPLITGDIPFPRDAEAFVKVLQSTVLKAVLPVWTNQCFTDCSYDFISVIISIIRHVYSGVEVRAVSSSASSRLTGPPPNESTISTIAEMGFSRSRAEEALRQVGANSVELAMEWLFSHPEESEEDDELARALALSLGSTGTDTKNDDLNESNQFVEQEMNMLPPVDELLATCVKLLQMKEHLAFPVRDLLVMICSQNDGKYRSTVICFLVNKMKHCGLIFDCEKSAMLSALFHVLALILHEDSVARDVAFGNGLTEVSLDLLSLWDFESRNTENLEVPKWVAAAFVAMDRLLNVDQKLNSEIVELLKKDNVSGQPPSITIEEKMLDIKSSDVGSSSMLIDIHSQKRFIEIGCSCIRKQLPSEIMHAVLQLCSRLMKNHSVAVSFLDGGGLPLLLSLPTSSLFSGFDNVAATIIRYILEDPQTLQQAMESEIRHSILVAASRNANGRVTPRNFLSNLASLVSRDPIIFMQSVQSVCQVEMVGDRPYIVLLKDRDKDKLKEKDKEREKSSEKDKQLNIDGKVAFLNSNSTDLGTGQGKSPDSNSKNLKINRKSFPSFVNVIEILLDFLVSHVPQLNEEALVNKPIGTLSYDMEIDIAASKGKGKALATASEDTNQKEAYAALARIIFIMKLLTEILWMYASSVHVLLRKDAEVSNCRGVPTGYFTGGIFHHFIHKFVPYTKNKKEKKVDDDWRNKMASRASQLLVASCVRSAEARKRIFVDISTVFNDFVDLSTGFKIQSYDIQAYIDLLSDVLASRSPLGFHISQEASATFIDAGLVRSLTRVLQVLDLDHVDSPKVVTGLIKLLELVAKEHVRFAGFSIGKSYTSQKPAEHNQSERGDNDNDVSQPMETTEQALHDFAEGQHVHSLNNLQAYGSSEAVTDDMEHDQDIDGGFAPASEDDYMHEISQDTGGLDNGIDIRFEIQSHVQENLADEEDETMSGDEVDEDEEDDEDDEDHNDLEEDAVHHLPHPDTDQEDHEIDDDEFEEEVLEDDENDEDDEDGVILRLEEGINGINVFDHIEVFSRDNNLSNEALHVLPVEVFGSRRSGRNASVFSLLGRTGDSAVQSLHPLLVEPSSSLQTTSLRTGDNVLEVSSDRNSESTSRLETVFRSLRHGRRGGRQSLLVDDNQQGATSNASVVPQGLEELLVSRLRQPSPERPSLQTTAAEPQNNENNMQSQEAEASVVPEIPSENSLNVDSYQFPPSSAMDGPVNADVKLTQENDLPTGHNASNLNSQSVEMQFEHAEASVRDVEAVSQESSGSGATLGESLRSLDVEIGSADGHDDATERQGSADRIPLGDVSAARLRRTNVSFGNSASIGGRELSLHSVTEVSENSSGEADHTNLSGEQQINDTNSGSIDPAFLDALPEELRAEVFSAQQGQVVQPSYSESQNSSDIDPEFLAALPPDIRAEVLAQQQAQRLHQSHELEGQPVEMDTVSIIATFPSELREEVLLTSSDAVLANLTPALVAEANMLRERFAHSYHNRTLFGMYPRSRRGESSRRGGLDRAGRNITSRRSPGGKPVEAGGVPLVDSDALKSLIRVLRVVQPLYKGHFQKLLLYLCAHHESRTALVNILMDMLMLDTRRPVNDLIAAGQSHRLYDSQGHVMYSRPQFYDGVPPLVSRRILETLTYLARNHIYVAKSLVQLKLSQPLLQNQDNVDHRHGKGLMVVEEDGIEKLEEEYVSISQLLRLLNLPLYLRSVAHLEQLLNLLEVIIDNADKKVTSFSDTTADATEQPSDTHNPASEAVISGTIFRNDNENIASTKAEEDESKPSSSGANLECDSQAVLLNLPQAELQLLCSFLAREGLSDNAYTLVGEVLKKLVTIIPSHCHLFITELAKSIHVITKSAMEVLHIFGESEKAFLNTSSSDGAAVLRVVQSLSSLVGLLNEKEKEKDHQPLSEKEHATILSQLSDINAAMEPLWVELSFCINRIESYSESAPDLIHPAHKPSSVIPPLPAGTQNILPYIESFFVMCEKLHLGQSRELNASDTEDASTSKRMIPGIVSKVDEKHTAFVKFSDKHRKLLNAFIRQNPGLLEKSFALMLKVPRFIDFDNKRAHFVSKIKHQHDHHHGPLRIAVRRAYILEDSYNQLRMRSAQDLKGRLTVHFQGEEGIDAGGLTREWYQLLSRVVFDKGALLFTTVGNESTFQPNPNSVYQTEHLSYFKFIGRVVGKALFDSQLLDVHFTRSFYKHILGAKVTYHDIEAIDPGYFKNLKWMLENDISDVLDLTFSIDADEEKLILYEKTEVTDHELVSGGRNVRVTEENKHEYVDLVAEHRLTTAIRPQINAFLEGFNELISRDLISIFNDKELELLISGLPEIDLDDMRANTEYSGYTAASPIVQWFWDVVQGFSKEDRARLLQFVTGTSKVPLEGFSALQGISGSQKFQIHKAYGSKEHLPSAHTCFNQLDLPEYPSQQHLEERLLLAIHEANEGFGFG